MPYIYFNASAEKIKHQCCYVWLKLSEYIISVSSLLGINAVELRDALTTNSNVTRGEYNKYLKNEDFYPGVTPKNIG